METRDGVLLLLIVKQLPSLNIWQLVAGCAGLRAQSQVRDTTQLIPFKKPKVENQHLKQMQVNRDFRLRMWITGEVTIRYYHNMLSTIKLMDRSSAMILMTDSLLQLFNQAKMAKVDWFKLLKCEDRLLVFVLYYLKWNNLLDRQNKTFKELTLSPQNL